MDILTGQQPTPSVLPTSAAVELEQQPQHGLSAFTANPLFTGGAGLMGVGLLLGYGRKLAGLGAAVLRRRFVSTLELSNEDQFSLLKHY